MIQMGHHLHNLVAHSLFNLSHKEYIEMTLHHLSTIAVMLYSYYTNCYDIGVTILLLHDIGDVFLNLAKSWRDLRINKSFEIPIFLCLMVSWIYPRSITQSFCLIYPAIVKFNPWTDYSSYKHSEIYEPVISGIILQQVCLVVLYLLNIFWGLTLLRVAYIKSKHGSFDNDIHGEVISKSSKSKEE